MPAHIEVRKPNMEGADTRLGVFVLVGFLLVNLALLVSPLANALHWAFPCLAILAAIGLLRWSPRTYLVFTLWCWILTPLFRRLVDYRSIFADPSPMLLAPPIVTLLCLYPAFARRKRIEGRAVLPHFLIIGALLFGAAVGLVSYPAADVARAFLNWFVPVSWGLYLATSDEFHRDEYRSLILRHMTVAVLLLGLYGIFQYLAVPAWDKFWLDNTADAFGSTSFGQAESLEVRVWSTLNGPFVFAGVMLCGLLLIASKPSVPRVAAAMFGGISFMLSLVRTGWVGFILGFLLLGAWKKKNRARLLIGALAIIALLVVALSLPPFRDKIVDRVQTMSDIKGDGSVQERRDTQTMMLGIIAITPFGQGLTSKIPDKMLNSEPIDSCVFDLLFYLGWPGAAVVVFALSLIAKDAFVAGRSSEAYLGFASIVFSLLIQMPAGNILIGTVGVFFWTAVSLARKSGPLVSVPHPARLSLYEKYV